MMGAMRSLRPVLASALVLTSLLLAACGSDDASSPSPAAADAGAETSAGSDGDVVDALEAAAPEGTVEVPSDAGATTIAEYAAGSSGLEPADPEELAMILAIVGTDADGYITDDAVVVRTTVADSTLLCGSAERLDITTYQVIPVGPDGVGIACS
jgi:hypothetical protein